MKLNFFSYFIGCSLTSCGPWMNLIGRLLTRGEPWINLIDCLLTRCGPWMNLIDCSLGRTCKGWDYTCIVCRIYHWWNYFVGLSHLSSKRIIAAHKALFSIKKYARSFTGQTQCLGCRTKWHRIESVMERCIYTRLYVPHDPKLKFLVSQNSEHNIPCCMKFQAICYTLQIFETRVSVSSKLHQIYGTSFLPLFVFSPNVFDQYNTRQSGALRACRTVNKSHRGNLTLCGQTGPSRQVNVSFTFSFKIWYI